MKGDLAEAQYISSTTTSNQRRTSFVDMCQSATKRIGSHKDPAEHTRAKPVGELSPATGVSSASGRCQAPAFPAARESALPESPSPGKEDHHASDFISVGSQERCMATTQGRERAKISGEEEVTALRDLVQRQKEDLEMAASIGQQLLDSNDDLSTKLEAAREEKWLADCECEALRRDLEHATQRCEQLDDVQIEAAPETEVEGMSLWSPAAGGGGATRPSISDDGCVTAAAYGAPAADAADAAAEDRPERREQQREADRLRGAIEELQQANSVLREELLEARLETTALRHTSMAHEQAARDQERREAFDEDREQQYQQHQQHLGGAGVSASEKPWAEGSNNDGSRPSEGESGRVRDRRLRARLRGSENDEPQISGDANDGENGLLPEEETEEKPQHVPREGLSSGKGEEGHCEVSHNSSGGDESKVQSTEAVTTTTTTTMVAAAAAAARLRRCQSSSAFKDTEEQAELIDALREQVSQLRLQAQLSGASRASAAVREARHGQNGATGYNPHDFENTGPRWSQSKCSSDEDSESDRGSRMGDDITHSSWPNYAPEERLGCEDDRGGSGSRRIGGGHVETSGNGDRADDALNVFVLRGRVSELSSELKAATCALDALRQRAKQQQAANLELQREILRLHLARHNDNGARMSEEVARVSAPASRLGHRHHTMHHDHGGRDSNGAGVGSDSSGQHPIDCFKTHGLSWLSWLWRILIGAREDDGATNGIEGRSFVDEAEAEKGSGCCSGGGGDGDFAAAAAAGDEDGVSDNSASCDGAERDDARGSPIHESALLLNDEREKV